MGPTLKVPSSPEVRPPGLSQNGYFEDEAFIGYLEYHQYWQNLKVHKYHYVSQVYITFMKIMIATTHIFIIIECNIFLYACCLEGLISDAGNERPCFDLTLSIMSSEMLREL